MVSPSSSQSSQKVTLLDLFFVAGRDPLEVAVAKESKDWSSGTGLLLVVFLFPELKFLSKGPWKLILIFLLNLDGSA